MATMTRVRPSDVRRIRGILLRESPTFAEAGEREKKEMMDHAVKSVLVGGWLTVDDVIADFEANW